MLLRSCGPLLDLYLALFGNIFPLKCALYPFILSRMGFLHHLHHGGFALRLVAFMRFSAQFAALGIVGVLLDDSVLQLWLFCAMHSLSFLLVVFLKPFANW